MKYIYVLPCLMPRGNLRERMEPGTHFGASDSNLEAARKLIGQGCMGVIEGGASSGRLPQAVFGWLPISNTSSPPAAISACANHGLSQGLPLSVADCMYLFCADTWLANTVRTLPLPIVMLLLAKMGLPIS